MTYISNFEKVEKLINGKKLLIFDFDGVLADSVEIKTQAFYEMYLCYGKGVASRVADHHRKNGGMSRADKFIHYHQEYLGLNLSEQEIDQMSGKFSNLVNRKVIGSGEISGSIDFLERNCNQDYICCVNSATPQDDIRMIVQEKGWAKYFSEVLGSPLTKESNLAELIGTFDVNKWDCLFFGDSNTDLEAASNSSIEFIGVGKAMQKLSERSGAFLAIPDFSELFK